jgi:hypothetical protein
VNAAGSIGCARLPSCGVPARRDRLRQSGTLNGIDYVEVGDDGVSLCVHLFGDIPAGIGVANVRISGGERITGVRAISVTPELEADLHDDPCLRIVLDREGDHTPYCLCLVDAASPADDWQPFAGFDPRHACIELHFRLDCAKTMDCATTIACVPSPPASTGINYLAKDYASFRQLLLDRIALDLPSWQERHVPDLGIALVEVLAYTADHLSYYQDAVATEAYLATARRRISVRRHARLVDYRMHEGCNARALVTLATDTDLSLPLATLRLLVPPPSPLAVTPGLIDAAQFADARAQGALVFEPIARAGATVLAVFAAHSAIRLHSWGDELCCLPRGSTRATLVDSLPPPPAAGAAPETGAAANDAAPAVAPSTRVLKLAVGDLLIFEQVLGTQTGDPADADPDRRHAVRLTDVQTSIDPLDGTPLLEVAWAAADALPFDLCLSVRLPAPDCSVLHDVSLARGNVLLVDHGDHVPLNCPCDMICAAPTDDSEYPGLADALAAMPDACTRCHALGEDGWLVPGDTRYGCCHCDGAVLDARQPPADTGHTLPLGPLTWAEPVPAGASAAQLFVRDPRQALPQLAVYGGALDRVLVNGSPDQNFRWDARYDLLESGPDDRHYVVEVDDDGIAQLRFGEGTLGRQPQAGDFFRAAPRIGNGVAGNVGRDSIVWLALTDGSLSGVDLRPRNPLPACGGVAAESVAEVKRYAPGAFRAQPLRAIVADDYAAFAAQDADVQGAACALQWNGSWYEANVAIDPRGREVAPRPLTRRLRGMLERYRRIGHDVAVRGACYVPLQVALHVCVQTDFLRAHVEAELRDCFSAGLRRNGTPGFFHPDRLLLGAPVYASALLAAAQAITGVAHVEVTTLARVIGGSPGEVPADGVLRIGPREIAQLDNDPDWPDHGRIAFTLGGGR